MKLSKINRMDRKIEGHEKHYEKFNIIKIYTIFNG